MENNGFEVMNYDQNAHYCQSYDLNCLVYSLRDEVLKDATGILCCNCESESTRKIWKIDRNLDFIPSNKPIPFENAENKISSSNSNMEATLDQKKVKKKRKVGRTEDENQTLKGYKFKYRYLRNAIRKKRVIVCQYGDCRYEFTKTWNFLDHAHMHLNIKPFQWSICGAAFTQKGNMIKHQKQHEMQKTLKQKIHKCKFCYKSYTEKYNLKVNT